MVEIILDGVAVEPIKKLYEHQADATLSQANPVSGTKYTVLDTTKNVRIIAISVSCTWTVQPTPLEIHITIDGVSYTAALTDPVSSTGYEVRWRADEAQPELSDTIVSHQRAFLLEGRSVKVEAEITGGTVSNLGAIVKHAKIP